MALKPKNTQEQSQACQVVLTQQRGETSPHPSDFVQEHACPYILRNIVVDNHGGLLVGIRPLLQSVRLSVEGYCVVAVDKVPHCGVVLQTKLARHCRSGKCSVSGVMGMYIRSNHA
jgi:hypothetical protein